MFVTLEQFSFKNTPPPLRGFLFWWKTMGFLPEPCQNTGKHVRAHLELSSENESGRKKYNERKILNKYIKLQEDQ